MLNLNPPIPTTTTSLVKHDDHPPHLRLVSSFSITAVALGKGTTASVRKAVYGTMEVAAKLVDLPSFSCQYETEAKVLGSLNHFNIIKLHGTLQMRVVDKQKGVLFLDLLAKETNPTLETFILKKQRFSERNALQILSRLVDALSYLHSRGYAHRDLKPSNCCLRLGDLQPVLFDFGYAFILDSRVSSSGSAESSGEDWTRDDKNYSSSSGGSSQEDKCRGEGGRRNRSHNDKTNDERNTIEYRNSLVEETEQVGTPLYMSPEVLLEKPYNPFCVDVWGLGMIFYGLLFAEVPTATVTDYEALVRMMQNTTSFSLEGMCSSYSEGVKELLDGMLAFDPKERFSIEEVKVRVVAFLG